MKGLPSPEVCLHRLGAPHRAPPHKPVLCWALSALQSEHSPGRALAGLLSLIQGPGRGLTVSRHLAGQAGYRLGLALDRINLPFIPPGFWSVLRGTVFLKMRAAGLTRSRLMGKSDGYCDGYSLQEPMRWALFLFYSQGNGAPRDCLVQRQQAAELGIQPPSPGARSGTCGRTHSLGVPARRSPLCPVEPWGVVCGHGRGRLAERRKGQPCPQGAQTCSSCVPGWMGLCSIKNGQGEGILRPSLYVQKLWSLTAAFLLV